MSRSFKKQPFIAICGDSSARWDKFHAHRGERSVAKKRLRKALREDDFDNFINPHRLECPHNEVWGWSRDGNQRYCVPGATDWHDHLKALDPETHCLLPWMYDFHKEHDAVWPPAWFTEMMRK